MEVIRANNVINGKLQVTNFKGRLLKVSFNLVDEIPNLRVKFTSSDGDVIIDTAIIHKQNPIYPRYQVQINEHQHYIDYYYLDGDINIEIIGLGSNQAISEIKLYYD